MISLDKLEKKYTVERAINLTNTELTHLWTTYGNYIAAWIQRFIGTNRHFKKAEGIYLIDENGNTYLDFLAGYGSLNLGHEHPEIIKALRTVEGCPNILQASINPFASVLAEFLCAVAPQGLRRVFFCNSGTETIEAAIKLARVASHKTKLVSCLNAYHGKSFGALSVSGKEKYRLPYAPLLPETTLIPYNDLNILEKTLRNGDVAAFIVEPIQGEAGVIVPDSGYLKSCQEICSRYQVIFIVDEVQTGLGRTGALFCCNHEQVTPDILCLSKSLGGGVMPIGAMLTTDILWKKAYGSIETCLLHTSTFGGNSRACACGIAALNTIIKNNLSKNAEEKGKYLLSELTKFADSSPLIKEVRGKGLMIGIHFHRLKGKGSLIEGGLTLWIVRQLLRKYKILTAFTLNNYDVIRIMPPLIVEQKHIVQFLEAFKQTLREAEVIAKLKLLNN